MEAIPYGRHDITEADIESVVEVLRSDFLTQGPKVSHFERLLKDYFACSYVIAFNSASSALHALCLADDLSKDDEVWVPSISYVATANCAALTGAKIRFIDINYSTGNLCVNALSRSLEIAERNNQLPKLVIPVHLAGHPCDMDAIVALSDRYGFSIIEDASHAIGSTYNNTKIGTCINTKAAVFSFHPVKIISSGEGGIVCTNDEPLARKLLMIRENGITKNPQLFSANSTPPWHYEQHLLGHNYKMTDIHAALGISQLNRLDNFISRRNEIAQLYLELLSDYTNDIRLITPLGNSTSSYHLLIAQFPSLSPEQHIHMFSAMRNNNIFVQLHYQPIHLQPYYQTHSLHSHVPLTSSIRYSQTSFSIPLYPGLTNDQVLYITRTLVDSYENIC